jgi:hypothetical protein
MSFSKMFLSICAVLGLITCLAAQKSTIGNAQPVISISIAAVQGTVKSGVPVRINVTLENRSSREVEITHEIRGQDCHLEVRDSDGKLAPDTKLGYVWNGNAAYVDPSRVSPQDLEGNLVYGTLRSGEKLMWKMDAAALYDMTKPGKYTIQVWRGDAENPALVVKSNTIAITVAP